VTDERVDEELTSLRERFATLLTVERPAAMGDFVTIDLSASQDGEPIEKPRRPACRTRSAAATCSTASTMP
jgi:FKBP-type peptidyl-prolyl cis-trans isomerase (trigger factor)